MTSNAPGRLLLTGAPGWLADAFLQSLASAPVDGLTHVRCLVQQHASLAGIKGRWRGLDVEMVQGDLADPASLARAVTGMDTVVHGAAVMHVKHIGEYYAINAEGTRRLARAASNAGVKQFVYISSNAAGGRSDSVDRPLQESDEANPLSPYGRSKWLGEQWLFATPGSMARTVIRGCMYYGPPVPARHVEVYRRIASGRMPLVGGGEYARSLTHIDNLLQGVRLVLGNGAANGEVFNIADAQVYTTRKVVEAMAQALGVRPKYIRLPAASARVAYGADWLLSTLGIYQQELHLVGESNWHVGVSIDKARRLLGYEPRIAIAEGMHSAVQWCRDRSLL